MEVIPLESLCFPCGLGYSSVYGKNMEDQSQGVCVCLEIRRPAETNASQQHGTTRAEDVPLASDLMQIRRGCAPVLNNSIRCMHVSKSFEIA
jgi:hypothetical protein